MILGTERPSRPLLVMQLLVQQFLSGDDTRAYAAEAPAPVGKRPGTKRPCFVAGYDDLPVAASDEDEACRLAPLFKDELRVRVSGNLSDGAACQQALSPGSRPPATTCQ
jgi:hypothetical protein